MKKKQRQLIIALKPVKLYLEDIENIFSILSESFEKVTLNTEEYEFDSVDELSSLNSESISRLSFFATQDHLPSISLSIFHDEIGIYVNHDTILSLGVVEKIKQILKKRERSLLIQFLHDKSASISFGISPFVIFIIAFIKLTEIGFWIVGIVELILFFGWVYIAHRGNANLIILKKSVEAPSFIKRNSEKITVAVITFILTLIAGYIFGKITRTIP